MGILWGVGAWRNGAIDWNEIWQVFCPAHTFQIGYCTFDNACTTGVQPEFTCEGTQGISAGCQDTYDYNQPCNMIDITTLSDTPLYDPQATYQLRVTFNPAGKVFESDYDNNFATVAFIPDALPVRS